MCGTAAEVTPIRSVDDHVIGDPGPITQEIQQAYWTRCAGATTAVGRLARVPAPTPAEA